MVSLRLSPSWSQLGQRVASILVLLITFFTKLGCNDSRNKYGETFGLRNERLQSGRLVLVSETCTEVIILNDTLNGIGYLHSPNYPENYPNFAECQWTLSSTSGDHIFLSIIEGTLEDSKDCIFDYLEIFDNSHGTRTSLGRFCGSIERRSYLVLSNNVVIVFATDASFSESGFKLKYSLENLHNFHENCNYTVMAHNGTIHSPRFPEKHLGTYDCWIHIKIPVSDSRVQLRFDVLSTEKSHGCNSDYISVYDGSTMDADVLGTFCNKTPNNEVSVVSSTPHILLHFHSNHMQNLGEFSIYFSNFEKNSLETQDQPFVPKCPVVGTSLSGLFTSPNYPKPYLPDIKCRLILEAPEMYYFVVTFEDLDLEPDDTCDFDYIEMKDGPSSDSPILAQVCGQKENGYKVISSTNAMFVQFTSDGFMEFGGFKAFYNAVLLGTENDSETEDYVEVDSVHSGFEDDTKHEAAEWLSHQEEHYGTDPVMLAEPMNASVSLGETHFLDCSINSSNSAVIWLKDKSFLSRTIEDNILILANNTLVIVYMTEEMEGVYTCVVLTEFGALSFSAWVMLVGTGSNSCSVVFRQRPMDIAVSEGDDALLTCYAHDTDIFWSKDDNELVADEYVYFLTDNIIVLSNIRVNYSGVYACQAISKSFGCSKTAEATVKIFPLKENYEACGQPKRNHSSRFTSRGRVVSGHTVERGFFPWQAMMWERWAGLFCGGSLLNDRWVVTAAHCITEFHQRFARTLKAEHLVIRLGKHDQTQTEYHEKAMGATKIIVHPLFNMSTYDNDVAVILLSEVITFTDYILPVCLPSGTYLENEIYDSNNTIGAVTGWGMVTERGTPPTHLQVIYIPIVKWEVCRASTHYPVTENMFCAGYDRKIMGDACHGDSGGPFTVLHKGKWNLVGLVSWGEGCDREGKYGFYTKMSNVVPWIKQIIGEV